MQGKLSQSRTIKGNPHRALVGRVHVRWFHQRAAVLCAVVMGDRIDAIRAEETHWRDLAKRQDDPKKKLLYKSIADVAELKADELRLRPNVRPEGKLARSIVEEEVENNDLARFERFKRCTKRNLGGISVVAISVVGIITTIAVGARNAVKRGASVASKFAKTLGKIAEKAAPVLGVSPPLVDRR